MTELLERRVLLQDSAHAGLLQSIKDRLVWLRAQQDQGDDIQKVDNPLALNARFALGLRVDERNVRGRLR